jgi:serine/threonine protein kinase
VSVIQTVREYELHEVLGGGGMGEVYRARHVLLDQPFAVKVVLPALLENTEIRARFVREAQTLQRLDHPNILRFVTLFEDAGRLFLVTELLAGKPLDLRVHEGAEPAERAEWFHQTVRGVAHAHRRGVLHRDLKPGNLHVLPDGRVKILDFGIARPIAARAITAMGHLVGTPVYLPPEIILGETASSAAGPTWDVYTLGLLAYEMFTGRLPFDLDPNAPPLQLLNDLSRFYGKRSRGPELRAQAPSLSRAWVDAIDKALVVDPAKRLPDAGALLRLLDAAPALIAEETQVAAVNTENLAPEDATGIHVIRNIRPKPAAAPASAPPAPVSLPDPAEGTLVTRTRSAEGEDTQTLDARRRLPPWLLPAGGAFAAGLLLAVVMRSVGGPEPATTPPPPPSAPESAALAQVAPPATASPSEPATPPTAPVSLAVVAVSAPAPEAPDLEFDPVRVDAPAKPRPATPRERDAARPAAAAAAAGNPTVRETGTLNNVATHGVLSVTAEPSALVYVDDTYVGESPIRGRLAKPGRHEVKLVRNQSPRPYRRVVSVTIRAGHRTEVRHEEPAPKRR